MFQSRPRPHHNDQRLGYFAQLEELKQQVQAVCKSKNRTKPPTAQRKVVASPTKKRVRIRGGEKSSEWAIPNDASIICAGLACVDMQLNQATGGDGGESIETFEGEKSIGGGSVSMACKTLARFCHGGPLGENYMTVVPPVVHSVVPLCKVGNDDSGNKLLRLLEQSGEATRNVETKQARSARKRDASARTALAVLPIYKDGRRGCFFDAASNSTFSPREMIEMIHSLSMPSSGPDLDTRDMSADDFETYQDRVLGATPLYGAFLFGYPHLLPMLQGEALGHVLCEARSVMMGGGVVALDLNGAMRSVSDLKNDKVIGAALQHVDILHMNEDELVLLTGCEITNTNGSQVDDEFAIASAVNLFLQCGVAIVVVTRGKKGSFVSCNDAKRFSRSKMLPSAWVDCTVKLPAAELPPGTVINTNGAGDSFTAGFLMATMLRHTGMSKQDTLDNGPYDGGASDVSLDLGELEMPLPASHPAPSKQTLPSMKERLTPYQLYMRENYVSLRQQCNDDKKAIFTKCHEMWEQESEDIKSLYERKAREEDEDEADDDQYELSMRLLDSMDALDSAFRPRLSGVEDEVEKSTNATDRALKLEAAVGFASLVAAHHIDVSTRDLLHVDITRILDQAIRVVSEGADSSGYWTW